MNLESNDMSNKRVRLEEAVFEMRQLNAKSYKLLCEANFNNKNLNWIEATIAIVIFILTIAVTKFLTL